MEHGADVNLKTKKVWFDLCVDVCVMLCRAFRLTEARDEVCAWHVGCGWTGTTSDTFRTLCDVQVGDAPLHPAAHSGHLEVCRYLVSVNEKGAEVRNNVRVFL